VARIVGDDVVPVPGFGVFGYAPDSIADAANAAGSAIGSVHLTAFRRRQAAAAAERAARERLETRRAARRAARARAAAQRARVAAQIERRRRRRVTWNVAPIVTWYGPGFYGNRTACGVRYGRYLRGTAHRRLPCGTLVRFLWRGLVTTVPVVDRGPYASRQHVFDLTAKVACKDLKPRRIRNACFTRHNVKWRVVGRVNLHRYLARRRR
jgi:rare lipoprotein A (peptidoglycan hydrolase)